MPVSWFFACAWLILTAAVQFALSYLLPAIGQPLDGPALAVAGSGLGVGLLGLAIARYVIERQPIEVWHGALRLLGFSALVLPVLGYVWVLGMQAELAAVVLGGMLVIGALIFVMLKTRARMTGEKPPSWRALWLFAAGGLLVGLVASSGSIPDSLSLQFKFRYESRLDHLVTLATKATPNNCISGTHFPAVPVLGKLQLVCAGGGQAEFYAHGIVDDAYAYLYSRGAVPAADSCVFHLDGPWWEETSGEDGMSCPSGFISVGGP